MATLSLCMIVKNEEDTLDRCLKSVSQAMDEVIVVDTGSVDNTVKIAEANGADVYRYEWKDDFADARNFSFSKAGCDYIMWLDADDLIEIGELEKLLSVKDGLDGVKMRQIAAQYEVAFDEDGRCTMSYYRERIFLRKEGFKWVGEVHETIPLTQDVIYSDFKVKHAKIHPTEPGRNLRIYNNLLFKGVQFSPRQKYYYARELYYNGRYNDAVIQFSDFLSGDGWTPDKIEACILLSKCYDAIGDEPSAKQSLLKSFLYSTPTCQVCCEIGNKFFSEQDYNLAIFWYRQAIQMRGSLNKAAFLHHDYEGYIPCLQLCVCFDKLCDYKTAFSYNEEAALFKPESEAVKSNRAYFQKYHGIDAK